MISFTTFSVIVVTVLITFLLYRFVFYKEDKYTEVKELIQEMISQNSLLCENINHLSTNVDILHEEVELVKHRNEDLGTQIEKVRDILKDIIKN